MPWLKNQSTTLLYRNDLSEWILKLNTGGFSDIFPDLETAILWFHILLFILRLFFPFKPQPTASRKISL